MSEKKKIVSNCLLIFLICYTIEVFDNDNKYYNQSKTPLHNDSLTI